MHYLLSVLTNRAVHIVASLIAINVACLFLMKHMLDEWTPHNHFFVVLIAMAICGFMRWMWVANCFYRQQIKMRVEMLCLLLMSIPIYGGMSRVVVSI